MQKVALLLLLVLIFTGCVPKIEKVSVANEPNIAEQIESNVRGNSNDGLELKRDWWKIYNDEQLNDIIGKALVGAPSIKSVEARYKQATNIIKSAKAETLPSLSANGAVSRDRFSENDIYPPPFGGGYYSRYQANIELNYDFDFWNAKSSAVLSAKESNFAKKAYLEESKIALASAICKIYLSWSCDEKKVQIMNAIKEMMDEEYSILDAKFKRGLIDEMELNSQKARSLKLDRQIYAVKRSIEGKKESICILAGFEPSFVSTLRPPIINEDVIVPLPKAVYLNLLSHRADVSMQKYIVLSKGARIEGAKAQFYPNINLAGLVGFVSLDLSKFLDGSSSAPSGQIAVSLPIFDWGARNAALQGSVNEYNSAVYDYNGAIIKAANEVVGTLRKARLIESESSAQKEELEAKISNEKIAHKRLSLGLTGRLPYIFSKLDSSQSLLDGMFLKEEKALLQIDLIQALGGGYEDDQGSTDARK